MPPRPLLIRRFGNSRHHYIDGEHAELRDARPFWGLDTYQTQEQIAQAVGDSRLHVLCIGPAGEHLVRYAAIMTGDARAAGGTGMGAIMGSKRLKAIAVRGKTGQPPMARRGRFNQAARRALAHVRDDLAAELLKLMGSSSGTEYFNMLGAVPARYWTSGDFEGIENLNGAVLLETLRVGNGGCWGCWVRCGPKIEIPDGPYELPPVAGLEYETMLSLGSQLLIGNLKPVSFLGYQCDALGMDTISTGGAIGFAHYLYDQGVIGLQDTGDLDLQWGDDALVAQLIPMIAHREGFGDVLIAAGHSFPEIGVEITDPRASRGVGTEVVRHQNWRSFVDSSGSCQFVNAPIGDSVEMVARATGRQQTVESLSEAGERILTPKRLINLKLGLTRADEVMPKLLTEPLQQGGTEGFVPDVEQMLNEYYRERQWDIETGRPSPERLAALGLSNLTSP